MNRRINEDRLNEECAFFINPICDSAARFQAV